MHLDKIKIKRLLISANVLWSVVFCTIKNRMKSHTVYFQRKDSAVGERPDGFITVYAL